MIKKAMSPVRARAYRKQKNSEVYEILDYIFANNKGETLINKALKEATYEQFSEYLDRYNGFEWLVTNGDLDAIKLIYRLDPRIVLSHEDKIVDAALNGHIDIIKYLMSVYKYNYAQILDTTDQSLSENIIRLLFEGISHTEREKLLKVYVEEKKPILVKLLLEHNFSQKVLDKELKSARYYPEGSVEGKPNEKIIKLLLKAGAESTDQSKDLWPLTKSRKRLS